MTQIVTANRLIDGIVVFQDEAGGWSEDFARAAAHEDAAAALARASQDVAASLVVDPYAIEVELRNGHYAPKALREAIRARDRRCAAISASRPKASRRSPPCTRRRRSRMYRYDEFDAAFVSARVGQFREQVGRRLAGELTEDQFRPHRLMNGLYLQLHSYMLRIAVPYGTLNSRQMRKLAEIARKYDRGYGHFTTRQNLQFNWPALKDVPDILAELASVEMHAIQTSGNCIRNVTADHYAGVAADAQHLRLRRQSDTLVPHGFTSVRFRRSPAEVPWPDGGGA